MMIKVDQVRHVIANIYKRPRMGKHSIFIFTTSAMMKEAANSLLKVLEEPPEYATLFLLTTNPGEFLPTIRSRCITLQLAPLQPQELESLLAKRRSDWPAPTRALVARLSGGAVGKALSFDLETYTAARKDALTLLNSALNAQDHSELFRTTEGYRAGAEGKAKTDQLLRAMYSLLEDMLYVKSGTPALVRNSDIGTEIAKLAARGGFRVDRGGVRRDWARWSRGCGEMCCGRCRWTRSPRPWKGSLRDQQLPFQSCDFLISFHCVAWHCDDRLAVIR